MLQYIEEFNECEGLFKRKNKPNPIFFNELKNSIDQNLEVWSNACKLVTDGSGTNEVASIISFNS